MSNRVSEDQLNQALAKVNYRNSDLTKRDIKAALQHYKGLVPKSDTFIFNDGSQRLLLNLAGTIPVPYRGNKYNIPVSLWLLDVHPFSAPICFVTPTQDMQIKVSKHVDGSGKIYLPYLHEWNYPSSDLLGLIQICIVTFSEQPPVYSRKTSADAQPSQALPYPAAGYPGYPPYPGGGQNFAPYPNYPPTGTGYLPPAPPGYPPVQGGYPPQQSAGYPPSGYGMPAAAAASYMTQNSAESNSSIGSEHIKASILSAVEEKVRRRIWEEFSTLKAEHMSLQKISEDLNNGKLRLSQMNENLASESEQLDNSIKAMEAKNIELSELATRLDENTNDLDVDDAVTATAPLYRQLLTAYADESATEDAIYFLGEALNRDAIDVESFLKHVRNLSRKQFLLRATMRMCRQKAGLSM